MSIGVGDGHAKNSIENSYVPFGEGQVSTSGSYGRFIFGPGGSPEGAMAGVGLLKCVTTYVCPIESDECGCD